MAVKDDVLHYELPQAPEGQEVVGELIQLKIAAPHLTIIWLSKAKRILQRIL